MKRVLLALLFCGVAYAQDSASVYPVTVMVSMRSPVVVQNSGNVFKDVTTQYGAKSIGWPVRFNSEGVRDLKLRVQVKTNEAGTYRIELRNSDSSKVVPISFTGVADTVIESAWVTFSGSTLDTFKLWAKASTSTADLFIYWAAFERRVRVVATTSAGLADSITALRAEIDTLKVDSMSTLRTLIGTKVTRSDSNSVFATPTQVGDTATALRVLTSRASDSLRIYGDSVAALSSRSLSGQDSLKHAYDSLATHRTDINKEIDSTSAHRTAINARVAVADSHTYATQYDIAPVVINVTADTINWATAYGHPNWYYLDSLATESKQYVFSGMTAGQRIRLNIITDDSRNNAITWPSTVSWGGGDTLHSPLYGQSFYVVEMIAQGDSRQLGRFLGWGALADTTADDPDTTGPPAMLLEVAENNPGRLVIGYMQESNFVPQGYIFKVSPGVPIGDASVTDTTSTNYPTVSVQEVYSATFPLSQNTKEVTLATTVDPAKTFVTLPTYKAGNSYARANNLIAVLSDDGTKVTFKKYHTAYSSTLTDLRCYVVSFSKWVTVQHVDTTIGSSASSIDLAIPSAVDTNHSFPLTGVAVTGDYSEGNDFYEATFPNTTTLRLTASGNQGAACAVYAQIVSSDSFDVERVSFSLGTTDTTDTVTVAAVKGVDSAFSVMTYKTGNTNNTNVARNYASGRIAATDKYVVARVTPVTTTAATITGSAYIVDPKPGWPVLVRQQLMTFAASDVTASETIDGSPTSRSWPWGGGYGQRQGVPSSGSSTVDSVESWTFAISLTDSVTITAQRSIGGFITRLWTETIVMPEGAAGGVSDTVAFDSLAVAVGGLDPSMNYTTGYLRYILTGLAPSTQYYVAAKVIKNNGKISPLSNVLSVTTPANPTANNGDWFVDFADGSNDSAGTSEGTAFLTLTKALSVANAGDTIRVKDTTTTETIVFTKSFDPPLVIKAWAGYQPVWRFTGATDSLRVIFRFETNVYGYVLDSLALIGGGTWIKGEVGANKITIKNSYLYNHLKGEAGIWVSGGANWKIQNNVIDALGSNYPDLSRGRNCIKISGSSTGGDGGGHLIEYNITRNGRWAGIGERMENSRIRYNTSYGNKIPIAQQYSNGGNVVEHNTCYYPGVISSGNEGHGGSSFHHNVRYNLTGNTPTNIYRFNVVYCDTTVVSPAEPHMMNLYTITESTREYGVEGLRVYNNTIVNDIKGTSWTTISPAVRLTFNSVGTIRDNKFFNNVFVGYDSVAFHWSAPSSFIEVASINYQDFRANIWSRWPVGTTGKKMFRTASGVYRTLAEMKTNYTAFHSSNLDANPVFADTGSNNWQPGEGSPMLNGGTSLTTTTSAGTNTTIMAVADPYWFSDGQGLVPGDMIRLTSWSEGVRIVSKSNSAKTLTLEKAMSWSSGEAVYFGSDLTPNIGAY